VVIALDGLGTVFVGEERVGNGTDELGVVA